MDVEELHTMILRELELRDKHYQDALVKATAALDHRLEVLNEHQKSMMQLELTFATREKLDTLSRVNDERLNKIETSMLDRGTYQMFSDNMLEWRRMQDIRNSNMDGRLWAFGAVFTAIAGGIGILVAFLV